jgi:exodeoxyribonuclease VII small subunit
MPKKAVGDGEMTLESRLTKLEGILERLGEGGATLEQASHLYQEGIRLVKDCRKELRHARGRVEKLDRETRKLESLVVEE